MQPSEVILVVDDDDARPVAVRVPRPANDRMVWHMRRPKPGPWQRAVEAIHAELDAAARRAGGRR